jgi:hypothetical protein
MQLNKFFRLSYSDKLLFLYCYCLTGIFRIVIFTIPFSLISKLFLQSRKIKTNEDQNAKIAKNIGLMVARASKYTPWKSKCLVQVLVCKMMLRKSGIVSTTYIGMAKEKDIKLQGHAWISYNEDIILGGRCSPHKYKEIARFTDIG